jgi:hypothetical protein
MIRLQLGMNKKNIFLGIGLSIVLIGGVFVINQQVVQPLLDDRMIEGVVGASIVVGEYDFAFEYLSGVEGFALVEPLVATTSQSLKKAYLMFEYSRHMKYQSAEAGSQIPPAVSVFVFSLPEKTAEETGSRSERLLQWINENPQYTSFDKKVGEMTEVKIDGVSAIKYSTAGFYNQDFYIVSYSGNAYVFANQYEDVDDTNVAMFNDLINSVTFY